MEPVTHLMTGAVLARAGLNRKAAYATLAMVLAAEAPDLDTLWSIDGPVAALQHHRGWTHTLLGLPFEALLIVGAIWLLHRWRTKRGSTTTLAPIRWNLLYPFCLIALLSHILLDWTNNYGVRPFFPFNPHWYAGSFVFIFEPVLFAILLIALVAPYLFDLINSEVGARRQTFRGRGWAIAALIGIVALWSWRAIEHSHAIDLATARNYNGAPIKRVFASPYPGNPYRWHVIVETPTFYQLAKADTWNNRLTKAPDDLLYKPQTTLATLAAKRSWLGEAYLDWSSYPLVTDAGLSGDLDYTGLTVVTFHDLRFLYDTPFLHGREHPPLSGTVFLNQDHRVVRMEMDGRAQH
ncbi:metal-dependent hydrolase [Granulicella arctica]|uniref:Inner membrane protein n=1 Tax=Granulicella arctica TaxID=940613 RepID=A0A7Y9TG13_9BACT|nr:metal-dependent hydrolase [Granulicella arctica]NYF78954.1 inner membrane protein [Granulicella arctica]